MLPLDALLSDILIMIVVFSVFVVGTLRWKPRIWLHDFPADIQAMATPKTPQEQHLTSQLGILFLLIFFGLPLLLGWDLKARMATDFNFLNAWLYGYLLFFAVNLWDLIALDWIGMSLIDPDNPPIPGTAGAHGYRDYAFHFYAFLKGCLIGTVFATVFALIITLLT